MFIRYANQTLRVVRIAGYEDHKKTVCHTIESLTIPVMFTRSPGRSASTRSSKAKTVTVCGVSPSGTCTTHISITLIYHEYANNISIVMKLHQHTHDNDDESGNNPEKYCSTLFKMLMLMISTINSHKSSATYCGESISNQTTLHVKMQMQLPI